VYSGVVVVCAPIERGRARAASMVARRRHGLGYEALRTRMRSSRAVARMIQEGKTDGLASNI
jgi:hypothetical protein